jgi:hypothetical protein
MSDETEDTKIDNSLPEEYREKMHYAAINFDRNDVHMGTVQWDFWRGGGMTHWDAAESLFVARQLEALRPGVYAKRYPTLKASGLIPYNYNVDTGAEQYTVQGSDVAGAAIISKVPANNIPMVSMKIFEQSMGFFSMMLGYQYNFQEARNAIFARRPLSAALAMSCRELMERKLDDIAFVGDTTAGVKGLLTLSGTDTYTTPATGAAGSKSWDAKDSDSILLDLNAPIDQMIVNTNEVEIPDTMLLPTSRKRLISTKRVGDGTSSTVLAYFLANQEFISTVETTYKSESNTGWTGKRGVVYRKDEDRIEMVIPQPFEQRQPTVDGVNITTICHIRTGGIALKIPKSVIYFDEI